MCGYPARSGGWRTRGYLARLLRETPQAWKRLQEAGWLCSRLVDESPFHAPFSPASTIILHAHVEVKVHVACPRILITPYCKVCTLLQNVPPIGKCTVPPITSVPPITKCTPYYKVYPLSQSIYPNTKCTPYYKVYPLSQSVPPITKYTPYHKVYPLSQSIYPNTKCTPYHKVYPLLQSIPPITNNVPYYTEVYPLSRSKYSQLSKYVYLM